MNLQVMDVIGPMIGAGVFVALMWLVPEPARLKLNALLVIGASGVYLSGGFGLWELAFAALGLVVGWRALDSYRFVALGWLLHAAWDVLHHLYGNPIWPFMPTSSLGCAIFDPLIAIGLLSTAGRYTAGSRYSRTDEPAAPAR